jgi:Putative rhamnosyl transferase
VEVPFDHVLLTRFNTKMPGNVRNLDSEWLGKRLRLFQDICVPSVLNQIAQSFHWILFVDSKTPEPFLSSLLELSQRNVFSIEWTTNEFSPMIAAQAMTERGLGVRPFLITTRLDNDDALAPHALVTIQRAFSNQAFEFVNLFLGYELHDGNFYLRPYIANPFISLIERTSASREISTVYCRQHNTIMDSHVRQVFTSPAWLQVMHGDNIANVRRGVRVSSRRPLRSFEIQSEYLGPDVRTLELTRQNVETAVEFAIESLRDPESRQRAMAALRQLLESVFNAAKGQRPYRSKVDKGV